MIFGHAVEFIGNKSKSDVVGSVEATDRFENRAAESGVPRRIGRERRSEVRSVQVAGRCAQRREAYITNCPKVTVPRAGRTSATVRFAATGNRSPKILRALAFPNP